MTTSLLDDEEQEPEAESGRCEYVSPDGVRCRNHARPNSRFCGVHEHATPEAAAETKKNKKPAAKPRAKKEAAAEVEELI
jgi:NAD(P)H-dependent FMN reductase